MTIKRIYETAKDTNDRLKALAAEERTLNEKKYLSCTIAIEPARTFRHFLGFGGALTESAGYVLSQIPAEKRREALEAFYSAEKGNRYIYARTHLNSCDFSLENWACAEKHDESLESFSMEHPDRYIVPLIKEAQDCMGGGLRLFVSPWSPPAWMKDNGDMCGGKIHERYLQAWANYYIRFIDELKKRGIETWAVTVQNEPAAKQVSWESCQWTPGKEGEFAALYLGPALEKYAGSGKRLKLFVADQNRDILWDRYSKSMSISGTDRYIDGAAFHWYSGDQYENVAKASQVFPAKELFFTEGCVEGGPRPGAWFTGERYAHNIINDLNSGCTGWIDWNIALDMQGGPNHAGNFCDAPLLVDTESGELHFQSSYYYIGHFSRFIKPNAQRIGCTISELMTPATVDGRMGNMMEATAFKNSDNTVSLVVLNRTEADMAYDLCAGRDTVTLRCPPRGIQTLIIDGGK